MNNEFIDISELSQEMKNKEIINELVSFCIDIKMQRNQNNDNKNKYNIYIYSNKQFNSNSNEPLQVPYGLLSIFEFQRLYNYYNVYIPSDITRTIQDKFELLFNEEIKVKEHQDLINISFNFTPHFQIYRNASNWFCTIKNKYTMLRFIDFINKYDNYIKMNIL